MRATERHGAPEDYREADALEDLMVSLSNHEVRAHDVRMDEELHLWVYIVRCVDGSYYTGSTKKEPDARTWEHNEGVVEGYTHSRRPVRLVYAEYYERLIDGFARERQIKGWSRAKKEALIAQDWEGLALLARSRDEPPEASS